MPSYFRIPPGELSRSEQFYRRGRKKMRSRSHRGGILLSLFSKANSTSVLSLVLAGAVLLYTIPVPLAAQMPKLPIPINPPAAGGGGAGGAEEKPPAQQAPPAA